MTRFGFFLIIISYMPEESGGYPQKRDMPDRIKQVRQAAERMFLGFAYILCRDNLKYKKQNFKDSQKAVAARQKTDGSGLLS